MTPAVVDLEAVRQQLPLAAKRAVLHVRIQGGDPGRLTAIERIAWRNWLRREQRGAEETAA